MVIYFFNRQLPNDLSLGNIPKFPITVKIDYKIDSTYCFGNYDISKIVRQ